MVGLEYMVERNVLLAILQGGKVNIVSVENDYIVVRTVQVRESF